MRVIACGDALFSSRNLAKRLDRRLLDLFATADGVFANAEFCCPKPSTPPMPRRFQTAVSPRALDELTSIGVNMIGFANNHTGDFGPQGVLDTIEAAEQRDIVFAGIGRSLDEARAAQVLSTASGRIGLVAAGTTRAAEFMASHPGKGILPRPGLAPLRWGRAYVLPEREFEQLRAIDALLGTAASRDEVMSIEIMSPAGDGKFAFGSVFEGSVPIERGETAGVRTFANPRDAEAILANLRDAAHRSNYALLSLHCHEGIADNWYSGRPAPFIEEFARQAIEAGADAFIGHGPHMLRGIEFHRGKPIFYSLNSLFMEFEAGEHRMTPEMFESYGFSRDALPSDLHRSRARDAADRAIGFHSHPKFTHACAAVCDVDGDRVDVRLVPIDLGMGDSNPVLRGLPRWAPADVARAIAAELTADSEAYGVRVSYDESDGMLDVAQG